MRKILSFLFFALFTLSTWGQTINVVKGQVTETFTAKPDEMAFCCGTRVNIQGRDYPVSDISKIYIDDSQVIENTVEVSYNGNSASVRMPGDIAPYLTGSVSDAYVKILQSDNLDFELNYVLSGNSTNGSFVMDGRFKATVTLNGISLNNDTTAAINILNGKRINIIVADGTTNTFSDGANGTQKACFFVNGHAEFSGNGTINLTGNSRHAYRSDEYTIFKNSFGGHFNVTRSVADAMRVEQYLDVRNGTFSLKGNAGDGIDVAFTNNPADTLNGYAFISGGTFDIEVNTADTKGIKSDTTMEITGGTFRINVVGNGCKGIKSGGNLTISGGDITMKVSGTTHDKGLITEAKCRGIKVDHDFTFRDGNIQMTVTGEKAKAIKVDGIYYYTSTAKTNCTVDADGGAKKIN